MFSRPTLSALFERIRNDLLARLASDDVLRRSDTEVYARLLAAVAHGLYGFIEFLSRQVIWDTAEVEYLERWAGIFGITRLPGASATGTVTFTTTAGAVIPAGAVLQALDGVQFTVDAEVAAGGASIDAVVTAVVAGAAGNRDASTPLQLVSPIVGVATTAVSGVLSGGADIESDNALRTRLLARIQYPPHGGAAHDYIAWAKEVPGVTRAWVYPNELGLGTVSVRFVRDDDGSGAAIIPDAGEVAAVQDHMDPLRPVTADLTVVAPVSVALNFTIDGLDPDTTAVRDAITASLQDLLKREAEPGGTVLLSHIREAVSIAAGESDHSVTTPSANVVSTTGNISTMGTITWT